jgi:hypothetical protein
VSDLAKSIRIGELRGEIRMLRSLRIQAYPGGQAEREIDASIATRENEIARLAEQDTAAERDGK